MMDSKSDVVKDINSHITQNQEDVVIQISPTASRDIPPCPCGGSTTKAREWICFLIGTLALLFFAK